MRSFHAISWIALLAPLLAGSAYGTASRPTNVTRFVQEELEATVLTYLDKVDKCYLVTPNNETIDFIPNDNTDDRFYLHPPVDSGHLQRCRVTIKNLDINDTGLWILHTVSNPDTDRTQGYQLLVIPPETTEDDETKRIEYLPEESFDSKIGATHTVTIPEHDFLDIESCLIQDPEGLQQNLQTANNPAIEIIRDTNVACGVKITVSSEEIVGKWFLVSRGQRFSEERFEQRLPFTIKIEENVNAMPSEISVVEGNDFYIRLEKPASNPDTCKLLRPDGYEYDEYEVDTRYSDTCGYIVRNVNRSNSGKWEIVHGNRIIYRAPIQVTVNTQGLHAQNENLVWTRDRPVQILGPENTIYCKIVDPLRFTVFEGFGRCNITLEKVTSDHQGTWKKYVGLEGRVLTDESTFTVSVVEAEPKPEVKTSVTQNKPIVTLSCSVESPYPIKSCKFRDPSGRILLANEGVGEDRYSFHGQGTTYQSGVHTHDCGIQITNPLARDLGLWRCGVETEGETYYGFLPVLCPWALRDPEVAAAVISVPTLTPERYNYQVLVDESVTMSCSVQSAIRYCYFRAQNGTIYNVGPGTSTDTAVYAGAGFDAGECSIRFRSLSVADSGNWGCHVGFNDPNEPEQRERFALVVDDTMVVDQVLESNTLIVSAKVYWGRQLEYCRFVRIDGLGFTDKSVPEPYVGVMSLSEGKCALRISNPSVLDNHPWTVVAKIRGQDTELSRSTDHSLQVPGPNPDPIVIYRVPIIWVILMVVGLCMVMGAALVGPKNNRRWAYERATSLRNSFRHSFVKKAVSETEVSEKNTANAA